MVSERTATGHPRPPAAVPDPEVWDVAVIGGGNAGIVSALAARGAGASVVVLEKAPVLFRGGNSRHTRNIRVVHHDSDAYSPGVYSSKEVWRDLCGIGTGPNDEQLARLTVQASESAPAWMSQHGARWQAPLAGTLHLERTNRFFLGGGKALLNSYYRTAQAMGVAIRYDTVVEEVVLDGDTCTELVTVTGGVRSRLRARSVICASGGYEANIEWLQRFWGPAADNFHIRGPKYNDGAILARLLAGGAASAGHERGFHAVAVDARSPRYDGGIATRIDAIPYAVVLNADARRFYDEGEEIWPKRYATWGARIAEQREQIAYAVWDRKVQGLFLPPMYGVYQGASVAEVAGQVGLDAAAAEAEIGRYNDAVVAGNGPAFDRARLDGRATVGLDPPKTNWAQTISDPPFYAVPMRPGITFTYRGVAVDECARVRREDGGTFANVFAAGEIMSGNILSTGYMAGFGMTIGTVWGRIAGREAALHVHR